jgi:hypothetical protein
MSQASQPTTALFDRLDAWRHFPAYQLERRADIFFSLYLREVVEQELGVELLDVIIPEIPIKHPSSAQSFKADYLLTSSDRQRAFLVELKTDPRSRRTEQDEYLKEACAVGIESMLNGVRSIVVATKAHQKYYHLLRELETLGFITLPEDLESFIFPEPRPGMTKRLREISVGAHRPQLEVIFVQPLASESARCIDFATFARHVARHDDPLSKRFSESLLRWCSPAGSLEATGEIQHGDRVQLKPPLPA